MINDWLIDGPDKAPATVVLAHGAGAMMDTPFMATMAASLRLTSLSVTGILPRSGLVGESLRPWIYRVQVTALRL